MQMDLASRVFRAIERQNMFRAGDRVGVGVSGGADSVALLLLLEELRERAGIRLAVLHFNHQLRGAESDGDEQFVATLAAERGFDFLAGRGDVAGEARARGWNLEDAARRLRYAFFSSAAQTGGITRVAVAHTEDDQAETVLARLVRGTGPAGLAAIYPVKGDVVRPLLEVRRSELREYLERRNRPWREDASNLDTTRLRARLRHQVLPVIERELQPGIVAHLSSLAQMAREDEAFWTALVAERLGALARREPGRLGIRCADLLTPMQSADPTNPRPQLGPQPLRTQLGAQPEAQRALAKRLVRGLAEELQGSRPQLTAQHVDQVLHLAAKSSRGHRAELPGVVVERSFEWIWFEMASRPPVDQRHAAPEALAPAAVESCADASGSADTKEFSYHVKLGAPGETATIAVPEIGTCFRLKVIDWHAGERDTRTQGSLDRDLLHSPLFLRSWRPGDSFRPQGRQNVHKLKQLFREGHISVRERAGWPVLTSAGSLAWSRGFPVAAKFAPRPATQAGVVIAEEAL